MGSMREHQRMQKSLVERLLLKPFREIRENIEYSVKLGRKTLEGEVDVLALSPSGRYHFYEIKSGKTKYQKAQRQFDRYKLTHPDMNVVGIYVGINGVRRLR